MSGCTITVSNSVRISAPVGHASRQPAFVQCLQTLDMNSQRSSCWWPFASATSTRSTISSSPTPAPASLRACTDGMPPGRRRQRPRVVVGPALAEQVAVGGQVVPLLARHLARLAADADGGVGEEAHPLGLDPGPADRDLAQRRRAHSGASFRGGGSCPAWLVWPALSGSSARLSS